MRHCLGWPHEGHCRKPVELPVNNRLWCAGCYAARKRQIDALFARLFQPAKPWQRPLFYEPAQTGGVDHEAG